MKIKILIITLILLFNFVAISQANVLYFDDSQYDVNSSETFNVTVYAEFNEETYGFFIYEMYWDSSIAKAISYENLSDWELVFSYGGGLTNNNFTLVNWWKMSQSKIGLIPLVNITFQALKKGQTTINFKSISGYHVYGINITGVPISTSYTTSKIIVDGGSSSGNGGGDDDIPPLPIDTDGDGVPDDDDICPGFDDNIDTDEDGIPDGCDPTPNGTEPIENQPPVAVINGPDETIAGESAFFEGWDSYDNDGNIASYTWDVGNSTSKTGPTLLFSYTISGTYTITLTVIDDDGALSEATHILTVKEKQDQPDQNDTQPTNKTKKEKESNTLMVVVIIIAIIVIAGLIYFIFFRRR